MDPRRRWTKLWLVEAAAAGDGERLSIEHVAAVEL